MCKYIYIYIHTEMCINIFIYIYCGKKGWTCSLFVFFLPQYIRRSTPMYWALFYESQNLTLYIYIYIYVCMYVCMYVCIYTQMFKSPKIFDNWCKANIVRGVWKRWANWQITKLWTKTIHRSVKNILFSICKWVSGKYKDISKSDLNLDQ